MTSALITNEKINFNDTTKASEVFLEVAFGVFIALLTMAAIDPGLLSW